MGGWWSSTEPPTWLPWSSRRPSTAPSATTSRYRRRRARATGMAPVAPRTIKMREIGSNIAGSAGRGSTIEFSRRHRSATDLLTHYFEVNFDDVAEELATTGPEPETRDTEAVVQLRQAAAAQLREFIRGLIKLRSEKNGVDAAQTLVQEQAGLTAFQRQMLEDRVWGIVNRVAQNPMGPVADEARTTAVAHAAGALATPERRARER